jgi:hypothetical protein
VGCDVTVIKNGLPTLLTLTIPASTTGIMSNLVNYVIYMKGETYDIQLKITGGTVLRTLTLVGTLSFG